MLWLNLYKSWSSQRQLDLNPFNRELDFNGQIIGYFTTWQLSEVDARNRRLAIEDKNKRDD
jgi:hypothetical protein